MPLDPEDANPVSLLQASLGPQSVATWRLFGYDASTESYLENQTLKQGKAYWSFSRESKPISITGTTANPAQDFAISLSKGWNLIGNPFAFDMYWGNAKVKVSGKEYNLNSPEVNQYVRQRYWWYEDATSDYVNNGVFEREDAPFDETHIMEPWHGYAVYALEDCELSISPSQNEPQAKQVAKATQSSPLWNVQLIAESGDMVDRSNYFGVSTHAVDGYDREDVEKPPFPSDKVSLSFPHFDWGRDANRYAMDYRSPFEDEKDWHITIHSANKGNVVHLRWNNINTIPSGFNAYLIHEVSGTTMDMRQDSGYSYPVESDRDVRDFQILVTQRELATRSAIPTKSVLLQNYPNPFNPETWIPYHLSRSGSVVIRIYNVSGQLVKTIDLGFRHAGYYDTRSRAAYWDGRNKHGEQVASGIYVVQITAGSFSATKKAVIIR